MATSAELLVDGFGRIRENVADVLSGLSPEQATYRIERGNPVSWLVWHLTRVQDSHVADAFGGAQVWAAEGWAADMPEARAFLESFGALLARARGVTCFVAERDGAPIATASLNVQNGIALMAGASTIPAARRQGAQQALFDARLAFARERGIELAMVVTQPGSASQRNAERRGFRPVYTRAKWMRLSTNNG